MPVCRQDANNAATTKIVRVSIPGRGLVTRTIKTDKAFEERTRKILQRRKAVFEELSKY